MSGSVTIKVLPNELTASSAIPGISAADKGDLSNWLYPKTKFLLPYQISTAVIC